MLLGRTSGAYAFHGQFAGRNRTAIPHNQRLAFDVTLDLPQGYWLVDGTILTALRNVSVLVTVVNGGPLVRAALAAHNASESPTHGPLTLRSVFDNVVAGGPPILRTVYTGGPGGGELGEVGAHVTCWLQTGPHMGAPPSIAEVELRPIDAD